MTSFSFPLDIKNREPPGPDTVSQRQARVAGRYTVALTPSQTGTAIGVTTIPLFVAPAGATIYEAVIDVLTGYDQTGVGTNVQVGTAANVSLIQSAVTVNTARRQAYTPTAAQVAAINTPFAVDTTVVAQVSIAVSTVTTGNFLVHVVID